MKKMRLASLALSLLLLVLSGCQDGALKFSIRYDTLGDLQAKAPVYFEETPVGHIEKIISTDGGDFLVVVAIEPQFKLAATENSRFYILNDPSDSDRKAIVIEQEPAGGTPLKSGCTVQGEKRLGFLGEMLHGLKKSSKHTSAKLQEAMQSMTGSAAKESQRLSEQLQQSLDDMDRSMQDFADSLETTLKDEQFEALKRSIDDFIEEFKRAGAELQLKIRNEILPQLTQKLEDLRNRLYREGRGSDAQEIDRQLTEILEV